MKEFENDENQGLNENQNENQIINSVNNQEVTHINSTPIPQAPPEVVQAVETIVEECNQLDNSLQQGNILPNETNKEMVLETKPTSQQMEQRENSSHNIHNSNENITNTTDYRTNSSVNRNFPNNTEYSNNAFLNQDSFYKEEVKKPQKRRSEWGKLVVACVIVSAVGGGSIGAGYGLVTSNTVPDTPSMITSQAPIVATPIATKQESYSTVDVIKAVKPTVVSISTQTSTEKQYFGTFSVPYETEGAGSGVIFYSDEERVAIATNNHVIDEATSIFVTFGDEDDGIKVPAKIAGTKSDSDLAVITVNWSDLEESGIHTVNVASFGNSDQLEVGDPVIAIGNAMGMGISATDGIISMTEQKIYIEESELVVLQTSAAINNGNSGGALVNSAGEVIGINTAKYNSDKTEGMGYAIPSNEIIPIIEELLLNGTQPKPFIGITGTSITADNASLYRLPVGALIMEVTENGPASNAGIQVGDIITQFDGKTIMDMEALITVVSETDVNTEVDIHVIRNGEESYDLKLIIGDKNNL